MRPLRAARPAIIAMNVPPVVSWLSAGDGGADLPKVRIVPAFLGATVDFSYDRAPIYIQLATLFRRLIVTGQWPVGQKTPTHEQLAVQLDVNPATIAKAITLLADEGLVRRSRRSGTIVIAKPAVAHGFRVGTGWSDLLRNFETLTLRLLSYQKNQQPPEPLHAYQKREARYDFSRAVYQSDGRPVLVEEAHIGHQVLKGVGAAKIRKTPPLRLVDQSTTISIVRADETVRFGIADSQMSELLQTPLNAPIAIVYHTVVGEEGCLHYHARSFVRGDLVSISEPIKFGRRR
jgi:GntR family transcriptional regulator